MVRPLLQDDFLKMVGTEEVGGGGTHAFGIFCPAGQAVVGGPARGEHVVSIADFDDGGAPQDITVHGKAAVLDGGQEKVAELFGKGIGGRGGWYPGTKNEGGNEGQE